MPDTETAGLAKPAGATAAYTGQRLLEGHLRAAEFSRNLWCVTPESEMQPGDFLRPETYAHCYNKLSRGDRIEVMPADGAWWGEFIVQGRDGPDVRVACLRVVALEREEEKSPEDYLIEHKEGDVKWRIVRRSDNMVVNQGFPTKRAAVGWLRSLGVDRKVAA